MCNLIAAIPTEFKWIIFGIFMKKRLLTTFLCSLFSLESILFVEAPCDITPHSDGAVADCSYKAMVLGVPQDLNTNLKALNLSHNGVHNLTKASFDRYKETLLKLDISNLYTMGSTQPCAPDSLLPLYKLEYLDVSNTCPGVQFQFPSRIRILKVENCKCNPRIQNLQDLEELYATGSDFQKTPQFHSFAPLKYVDLRHNTLYMLRTVNIAPFCRLQTLLLKDARSELFEGTVKYYCDCIKLEWWLKNTSVQHDELNCYIESRYEPPICDLEPTKDELQLREECLARYFPKWPNFSCWWLLGILPLTIFCASIPIFYCLRYLFGDKNERAGRYETDEEDCYEPRYRFRMRRPQWYCCYPMEC